MTNAIRPRWSAYAIALPDTLAQHITSVVASRLTGLGNPALLEQPLLGLLASRECPGHALLETLDRVPGWVSAGRVILSGFHAPLEQQVLRSVLRRNGRVVKLLAHAIQVYRPPPLERAPLEAGRMLVLTAALPSVRRTTRASALERNRLVLALAAELAIPYVADTSGLSALLAERPIGQESTP